MVVRRIQAWHAQGAGVDARIPALAAYLGHVGVRDVSDTCRLSPS